MAEIITQVSKFLTDTNNRETGKLYRIPPSPGKISPGDVLTFRYHHETKRHFRVVLAVANSKGRGLYTNIRRNKAISCYKISHTSPVVLNEILRILYKNSKQASYEQIKAGLGILIGSPEYRTYLVEKISDLQQIYIDKNNLDG